ncbi:uncharacterized protein LOC144906648 [Branchiostoma floridae x Branchiostoma belcheri]
MFATRYRNPTKPRRRLTFAEVQVVSSEENCSSRDGQDRSNIAGDREGSSAGVQNFGQPRGTFFNRASFAERTDQLVKLAADWESLAAGPPLNCSTPRRDYNSNRLPLAEHTDQSLNAAADWEGLAAGPPQNCSTPRSSAYSNRLPFAERTGPSLNGTGDRERSSVGSQDFNPPIGSFCNRLPFATYTNKPYKPHPDPGEPGDIEIDGKAYFLPPPVCNTPRFNDYVWETMVRMGTSGGGKFKVYPVESLLQTRGREGKEGRRYFCGKIRHVIKKYEVTGARAENFRSAVNEMLIWCPALSSYEGIQTIRKAIIATVSNHRNKDKTRREKAAGTYVRGQYKRGGERARTCAGREDDLTPTGGRQQDDLTTPQQQAENLNPTHLEVQSALLLN